MPTLDVAINALKAKAGAAQFDSAVKKVKRGAGGVDKSVKKNEKSFNSLGKQMKTVVTGMIGLAAAYKGLRFIKTAVIDSAAFEMQLANVSTMLDDQTMRYLPGYEKALSNLAVKYGQSTATLSKGLYDILSASIGAADATEVLEVASKAAIGGLTDTGTAADALTTIINAYGMEAEDAAKISDILFATVKRGKITFGELAGSIGKVIALAAAAGLSFEQASAAIATMTRAGISADIAMTSLKGIVTTFLSPQKENIEMAKKFGLELNTATLQTIGLTGALEKIKHATTEETAAMFSNVRALLGVAATRKSLNALVEDYEGILKSAEMAEVAYQKIAATTQHQLDRNRELWKQIKREIGEGILPEVNLWLRGMQLLVKDWREGWLTMAKDQSKAQAEIEKNMVGSRLLRIIPAYSLMEKAIDKIYAGRLRNIEALEKESELMTKAREAVAKEGNALVKAAKEYQEILKSQAKEKETTALAIAEVNAEIAKKEKEYSDDQATAYRRLYDDLKIWNEDSYNFKLNLLNKEKVEYEKFIKDSALLDKWYAERKAELDVKRAIESENFFEGFQAGIKQTEADMLTWGEIGNSVAETMNSSFADALMQMTEAGGNWKDAMTGFALSIGQAIRRMMAEQIAAQIMVSAVSPFTSALVGGLTGMFAGGAPTAGTLAPSVGGTPTTMFAEKGGILSKGEIRQFAKGDILTRPTIFPMSNGGMGLAGEAGKEAIMPLGRDVQGRLGVRADGQQASGTPIKIINVMDQSAVQEYLGTGDGERTIVNIMRRNATEIQEVVG